MIKPTYYLNDKKVKEKPSDEYYIGSDHKQQNGKITKKREYYYDNTRLSNPS